VTERIKYLEQELRQIQLAPSEEQLNQLYDYYEMVIKQNTKMNLTAIVEYQEFVKKHFVDSLILVKEVGFLAQNCKLIDIGTGAGFPGIPLKILFPELDLVLLDSLNKRIMFLDTVIRELGLMNIQIIHGRAEDYGRKEEYREQFTCCVSRAVANLSTLAEYCLPFVKQGGYFYAYKAAGIEEELKEAEYAIRLLGGKLVEAKKYCLPDTDYKRVILCIEKVSQTPDGFPRMAGKPSKDSLKQRG